MKHVKLTQKLAGLGLFASIALPLSVYAQGGDKVGGGGDLLKCTDNGVTQYWLLDMREGFEFGEKIALGSDTLNVYEKIALVRNRYAKMDEQRAFVYAQEAIKIAEDLAAIDAGKPAPHGLATYNDLVMPGTNLSDHPDENEIFVYKNCEIEDGKNKKYQLVRQGYYRKNTAYYVFDRERWHWLDGDKDQQVATLYHEAILRDHRARGQENSRATRELNRNLINGKIAAMSTKSYLEFLADENLGALAYTDQMKLSLSTDNVSFDDVGEVVSADQKTAKPYIYLIREKSAEQPELSFSLSAPKFSHRKFVSAQLDSTLALVPEGEKVKVELAEHYYSGKKSYQQKKVLSGGVFSPMADGTFLVQSLKKSYDIGQLSFTMDRNGYVLSKDETGAWSGEMSIESYGKTVELMTCIRTVFEKRRGGLKAVARVAEWLTAVRPLLYSQDVAAISTIVDQCRGFEQGSPKVRVSKRKMEAELSRLFIAPLTEPVSPWTLEKATVYQTISGMIRPNAEYCGHGFEVTAGGGVMYMVEAGLRAMTCTLTNGKRFSYAGVTFGLAAGGGAAIHINTFDSENTQFARAGRVGLISSETHENITLGVYALPDAQFGENLEYRVKTSRALHIGLEARVSGDGGNRISTMLRLARAKDDFSLIIRNLARVNIFTVSK